MLDIMSNATRQQKQCQVLGNAIFQHHFLFNDLKMYDELRNDLEGLLRQFQLHKNDSREHTKDANFMAICSHLSGLWPIFLTTVLTPDR